MNHFFFFHFVEAVYLCRLNPKLEQSLKDQAVMSSKQQRSDLENYYLSASQEKSQTQSSSHPQIDTVAYNINEEGDVIDANDKTFTTLDQVNAKQLSFIQSSWNKSFLHGHNQSMKWVAVIGFIVALKLVFDRMKGSKGMVSALISISLVALIVFVVIKKKRRHSTSSSTGKRINKHQ